MPLIIATPADICDGLIGRVVHAGMAMYCEKPVDLNLERAAACLHTVTRTDARLMVVFNRRFDPHFIALKNAIDASHIGETVQITIASRDPGLEPRDYFRVSGGIFRDMTIHDFDMARYTEAYAAELAQFIAAVAGKEPLSPSGDDGLAALQLAEAAESSVRMGQPVTL